MDFYFLFLTLLQQNLAPPHDVKSWESRSSIVKLRKDTHCNHIISSYYFWLSLLQLKGDSLNGRIVLAQAKWLSINRGAPQYKVPIRPYTIQDRRPTQILVRQPLLKMSGVGDGNAICN